MAEKLKTIHPKNWGNGTMLNVGDDAMEYFRQQDAAIEQAKFDKKYRKWLEENEELVSYLKRLIWDNTSSGPSLDPDYSPPPASSRLGMP